jgi:hypothetical protein
MIAVPTVLIAFNWPGKIEPSSAHRPLVDYLFSRIDRLQAPASPRNGSRSISLRLFPDDYPGADGRRRPTAFSIKVASVVRAVVVGPAISEGDASLGRRRAQRLVPEFVPQAPIEALDEGILHGFARRDVMPFDAGAISPSQDGVSGEFAAIVADHHLRLAGLDHQPVRFPRHTDAGE